MKGTDFSSLLKDMRRSSFNKKKGGRYDAKKVAVLIVDGNLEQPLKALREARHARVRGVEVYVAQVGNGMPQKEMKMMCDAPSQQHFFQVENYDELKGLQNQLLDILCDEL
ncbi:integrin alpha-D-like [Haliotis rufescens]|uniref:integrin alpha-D-like n=1 Tax=Haliotis rufescens TaxID=6454 RepID=UPI001EB06F90|nr:integrin alpha-D-like [Haliotis rufescens]